MQPQISSDISQKKPESPSATLRSQLAAIPEGMPETEKLRAFQSLIEVRAREHGLDFFPTIFEVVDAPQLNAIAACGGFPRRYPHYRFGGEFDQLDKGYRYGLQKIYELVINNNPCYAYLMRSNQDVDQKLVMAHVYGHCDFFKNNIYFAHTNRKMMDEMGNHATRIEKYISRYGYETVEEFIDLCLSIEDLIDIHAPGIKRTAPAPEPNTPEEETSPAAGRFQSKGYMDSWVNPAEKLRQEAERLKDELKKTEGRFPAEPVRDVMLFILENAPLKDWQRDVLSIVRDEAVYFAPQAQTKIMNEGWASYWHSTMMSREIANDRDVVCYADHHSGTLATAGARLNPYKLGIELFRDIEDRWNKGKFGPEYEQCDDWATKEAWDRNLGLGRAKIFEVRKIHNDLTFIDEFLTHDFCRRNKLFQFGYNEDTETYNIESREFPKIKASLLQMLTNFGRPVIEVEDANYKNRKELYLVHRFTGQELKTSYTKDTLVNVQKLWNRPVHIETVIDDEQVIFSFDGTSHSEDKVK